MGDRTGWWRSFREWLAGWRARRDHDRHCPDCPPGGRLRSPYARWWQS